MVANIDFPPCPICRADRWSVNYDGPVRDGPFGKLRPGRVARCGGCGVDRLAEGVVLGDDAYRGAYRAHVGQNHDLKDHFAQHDELNRFTLDVLWPQPLRGKTVVDVGCGGGSLLDHIRGLPDEIIAIDPDEGFAPSLADRGYRWYPSASAAAKDCARRADVAFAIQVIEHVLDPVRFLQEIRELLASDGVAVVSTPNRADILMDLLPAEFPAFFYRTQHRWYFDAVTLATAANAAGLLVDQVRHVHRYGMANALFWLRDRKPSGRAKIPAIDLMADVMWGGYLEQSGRADNLYAILKRA